MCNRRFHPPRYSGRSGRRIRGGPRPSAEDTSLAPSDASSSLAAERRLLDEARQNLARGEPEAGLVPIERHAARYPKGVLTEEREALAVRLLAALGFSGHF